MSRGPKIRSAANSHGNRKNFIRHEAFDPPCELSPRARAEYDRLVGVLGQKGTLDRVDLSCVAECARIKALLDMAQSTAMDAIDWDKAKLIGLLSTQHRGRLRELGLTIKPSNTNLRTNPVPAEEDPLAKLVKLSG